MMILTNDDGIDAPGIRALQRSLSLIQSASRSVIVAPAGHYSGCSHQVTTHRPIAIQQRAEGEYAIAGTPADCTRIALSHLAPDTNWVLSGVNAGGNLGTDVYISGTVAAVREAVLHRVPGIALSHMIRRGMPIDWEYATQQTARVLEKLMALPLEPGSFWNVNLPPLTLADPEPELVFCPLCTQPLPLEFVLEDDAWRYAGEYPKRDRDPQADVDVCFSGNIAITKIKLWN
ncbi:5'/3'-nucleotidase SurE [Leptolyngbya sp. AN02str]|uniref:5'/3'-nucleotidase SurE n=1 Tax=Leptolyngbya sp. AN02str TaxID=3423363 RepID=UPI003D32127D